MMGGMQMARTASRRFRPARWPQVIPRIIVRDAKGMVTFVKRVFLAAGRYQPSAPAELWVGDSVILVSEADVRRAATTCLYVYVPDADSTYRRALRAGARSIEAPALMPYGDRRAMVKDAWGNSWQIATRQNRSRKRATGR